MALTKICQRCGKRLKLGERCDCRASRQIWLAHCKDYNKRRDKTAREFYDTKAWRRTREAVKARAGGLDELRLSEGVVVVGTTVHHIVPRADDPALAYDLHNLILVSEKTHRLIHTIYDRSEEEKADMQARLKQVVLDREHHIHDL